MGVEMKCTGGRYPVARPYTSGPKLNAGSIKAALSIQDGKVLLRLDDGDHLDMWMELECSLEDLNHEYNEAIYRLVREEFDKLPDEQKRKLLLGE